MGKRWFWFGPVLVVTGLVVAGCGGGTAPAPRASGRTATSRSTAPSTAAASSPTTTTTTATLSASAPTTTSTAVVLAHPPGPGVLADCAGPPPLSLQVEPPSIIVACADAGIGAQDLVWSTWTSSGASGSGDIWQNDCTPDCANGVVRYYPASITLSDVQPSSDGPAFTVLTATYRGAEPNGNPTDTYRLELPPG